MRPAGSAWPAATTAAFGGVRLRGRGWYGRADGSTGAPDGTHGVDQRACQAADRPHGHHRRGYGRSALYLGTLSSAVIASAFVGQANRLGDGFHLFAVTLLPPVFLLGVFTYLRLVRSSIEDMVHTVGSFRISQYFVGLDPAAVPFFPPTDPQGIRSRSALAWCRPARCRRS
jgi:hypothetical protein